MRWTPCVRRFLVPFLFEQFSTRSECSLCSEQFSCRSVCWRSAPRCAAQDPRALLLTAKRKAGAFLRRLIQTKFCGGLRLFLPLVDLRRNSAHHALQLIETRLRFFAPRSVRIEVYSFLERFHRARLRVH